VYACLAVDTQHPLDVSLLFKLGELKHLSSQGKKSTEIRLVVVSESRLGLIEVSLGNSHRREAEEGNGPVL